MVVKNPDMGRTGPSMARRVTEPWRPDLRALPVEFASGVNYLDRPVTIIVIEHSASSRRGIGRAGADAE
jgi:hypothetical protein